MSERDRIEQALTFDTGCEPSAQEIIDALNRAGYQITPQAGEAVPLSDGFARYRYKAQFRELRPYVAGETLSERVSIGKQDKENGSPKVGDMIARNPKNYSDQWLVAAEYFAENFEVNRTAPPPPVCPHIRSSKDGTSWCDLAVAPVWQAIETAPLDEEFIGYFDNGEMHIVGINSETSECYRPMDYEKWAMPTHWQPLPSPPDSPGAD